LFALRERLERPRVEQALAALCRHHDALRLRFARTASEWQQRYADVDVDGDSKPFPLEWIQAGSIEAVCAETQASLDFERGPLARAVYFESESDSESDAGS